MPKGIPLTNQELAERRWKIAQAAGNLIIEKGFNETSVAQIARAAGMGKSTLYDYFSTKDEILLFLIDQPLVELTQRAVAIITGDGSAVERLRHMMHMHLGVLLADKAYYLRLSLEAQRLNTESQQHYMEMRYAYQDLLRDLIDEGIAQGDFRPVNPAMVMKSLLAIMSSVAFTTRPAGTPQAMLDMTLDIILLGIQK
jgi:AcrR family transcriptional regulator